MNGTTSDAPASRAYHLPAGRIVRRARGPYLYDQHGERYLDLWLADGAAFLGHRPAGYSRLAKAEIDRGLWSALPTPWNGRLERALAGLVPIVAPASPTATIAILNGTEGATRAGPSRWLPTAAPVSSTETPIGVVLPAPGMSVGGYRTIEEIPAFIAALLTRGADLLRLYLESEVCRQRISIAVESAVPPGYTRDGVWYIPRNDGAVGADRWTELRETALTRRIILPPDRFTPFALPGEIGPSDLTRWKRLCNEWPQ